MIREDSYSSAGSLQLFEKNENFLVASQDAQAIKRNPHGSIERRSRGSPLRPKEGNVINFYERYELTKSECNRRTAIKKMVGSIEVAEMEPHEKQCYEEVKDEVVQGLIITNMITPVLTNRVLLEILLKTMKIQLWVKPM